MRAHEFATLSEEIQAANAHHSHCQSRCMRALLTHIAA
uniref:Transcriptional regulator n=1 Tax=Rodentolepis nana TaxID=102285 RepID=A0A0R3T0J1_RODNA